MIVKQKTAWKEAAWIFGLSRLMILLLSYLAVTFLPISSLYSYMYTGPKQCTDTIADNLTCFLVSWWRWDATHYVQIAYDGYSQASLTAFFPLFPLLIHSMGYLLGGSATADYAAGLIVANSCFYAVLVLFYHLVSKDFGQRVAKYALIYLAFAPHAIFFFVGYDESLFLLLTLAIFLLLRRGKLLDWWLAGLCGFLVTLTRPTGIIVIVPFLVFFVQRFGMRTLLARENWPQKLNAIFSMTLIPSALLIYMLYLWITFGNPWLFSIEETLVWQRSLSFPWMGFFIAMRGIMIMGPLAGSGVTDIFFTVVPLVALILGWKQLPVHYCLFALALMLFVLSVPCHYQGLMSVPRFMLEVFPTFILFALWGKDRFFFWLLLVFSVIFFIANIVVFAIYGWVS